MSDFISHLTNVKISDTDSDITPNTFCFPYYKTPACYVNNCTENNSDFIWSTLLQL